MDHSLAAIILAAGKGARMCSSLPKVLHKIAERPMLGHVLAAVDDLHPARRVVVLGPSGLVDVEAFIRPHPVAIQPIPLGTGDAVRAAAAAMEGFVGDIVVLFGDTPLVRADTIGRLIHRRRAADNPAVVVAAMQPVNPAGYGRLVTDPVDGRLLRIVEHADADEAERKIGLCNGGIMAFDSRRLWALLESETSDNASGEHYLTDVVGLAQAQGWTVAIETVNANDVIGVNDQIELARAESLMQERLRYAAMKRGVTMTDPGSVFLSTDTELSSNIRIGPNVVFGPGVSVGEGVEILPFCHLEGVVIGPGARIGPFARLRPGTRIGAGGHVGNFVEMKNASLGSHAKANHLTYLGDAEIGDRTNIGAGVITCNYDGFTKSKTIIGPEAFIGSNTALVAPVRVGAGAIVAAGSVIVRDIAKDALAVARAGQVDKPGWGAGYRNRKSRPDDKKPPDHD